MPKTFAHASGQEATGSCPIDHAAYSTQKTARETEPTGLPVQLGDDGVWHVRGFREARAILRHDGTRQAGFQAEYADMMPAYMNKPVLFMDGQAHHEQRRQTAPFFTPKTTDEKYRGLMEALSDDIITGFVRQGRGDLSKMSMRLAVAVAGQVVGLTDSLRPGMADRIDAFIDQDPAGLGWRPRQILNALRNQWVMGMFYFLDVRPAIKARKREPQEDVISHLLGKEYTGMEILTECVTYGAAGMVTTREFISVATWHFLQNPELKRRYLEAPEKERQAILHEILRLEPVVGHLYRRAAEDIILESEGEEIVIRAGSLIDLHLYAINAEEAVVGDAPLRVCPGRELGLRAQPYVMSFGDGHHRCPGAFIAIQEADIFLKRLLALEDLTIEREPQLSWNDTVEGYELRGFILGLETGA
jgi:cytochrome P450